MSVTELGIECRLVCLRFCGVVGAAFGGACSCWLATQRLGGRMRMGMGGLNQGGCQMQRRRRRRRLLVVPLGAFSAKERGASRDEALVLCAGYQSSQLVTWEELSCGLPRSA